MNTIADALVSSLLRAGAKAIFGVPGGDSSLDLIEAARKQGLPFVLARTECAAVLMAAASTEVGARIGVALTTKGPGLASAINGIAHADLDRSPVVVISDAFEPEHRAYVTHQWIDQRALTAPLVRAHTALDGADPVAQFGAALAAATGTATGTATGAVTGTVAGAVAGIAIGGRRGPVHVELTGAVARRPIDTSAAPSAPAAVAAAVPSGIPSAGCAASPNPEALATARTLLASARRAVVVAGLECATAEAAAPLRALTDALDCAALVTYKAKGVIADDSPQFVGIFTGGSAEAPVFEGADLIVLAGVDPVELIPQPWRYRAPVIELCRSEHPIHYLAARATLVGGIAPSLEALAGAARRGSWRASEIAAQRRRMRGMLRIRTAGRSLAPHQVVETVARAVRAQGQRVRVTVDAGAHMFAATALWPCVEPSDLLISNGLATMGFALPAAIGAAQHDRVRPVIAFTGDGGLAMCIGELGTAVEQRAPVIVIVFNDAALSLIDIKQQHRGLPATGVRTHEADFRGVMRAFGGQGWRVSTAASLRAAVRRAIVAVSAGEGPCLIDVRVDPGAYPAQMKALRG